MSINKRIVVALDFDQPQQALDLARQLHPQACRLKVGKELFTLAGPSLVEGLQRQGFEVFLDLKFHDIPNTVAQAVLAASQMGVWMVNVHAQGGRRMMETVVERVASAKHRPLLIAVTVLTSMAAEDLADIGITESPADYAAKLARLTAASGFDGVVCSAQEAGRVKADNGSQFLTVTPGIRPASSAADDQRRIMTPAQAVAGGADYLVVGRPITRAADPLAALAAIRQEIGEST